MTLFFEVVNDDENEVIAIEEEQIVDQIQDIDQEYFNDHGLDDNYIREHAIEIVCKREILEKDPENPIQWDCLDYIAFEKGTLKELREA